MGPLLRKLDSLLLAREIRLPKPLKDGIELLNEDLEEIGGILVEHSMADSPSHKASYWMDEVRELSYHIEDCIDCMLPMRSDGDGKPRSVRRHKVGRVKIVGFSKTQKPCTRIARIAELRALVRESIERHERYQLVDGCISSSHRVFTAHGRARPLLHGAAYLVGIDEPKTKLTRWLTGEEGPHLKVAAIVGPEGIGKTALATELYREHRWRFECRAFVRASRKPDMRRLLGGILSQVQRRQLLSESDACTDSTVQSLIDNLREHLQDRRYFIVIDDLWETALWNIVNNIFPVVNNFSRIIITAEIEHVALECCGYQSDYIIRMKPLDSHDSGKVFFNRVFGSEDQCPDQLMELSNKIITKCGGLPLATISIAGLLASQPDNPGLWDHVQKCLCSNLSTNPTLEDMLRQILNLSYHSLPHYLKTCLLYLNMYPEGQTMLKADLLRRWIAEGFISNNEAKDIKEVADSYFHELVNRGMVQPMEINKNGEILSCTVHRIVHDHIVHKSKEDKFITSIDYSQTITGPSAIVRRLSLHFSSTKYASKPAGIMFSRVRSLAFFGLFKCMPCIMEFKLLRVLILEFWGNYNGHMSLNLTPVCRLCQLKYLKISSDIIVELPAQMCGLLYLETLEVNARVSAMPFNIVHFPNLLHLRLPDGASLPDGIGCMRSLRTLQCFDPGNNSIHNLRSLGNLTNLQDLHLSYSTMSSNKSLKKNLIALAFSLSKLGNLRSLTLSSGAAGTAIFFTISNAMYSISLFLQRLELLPPIFIFHRLPKCFSQLHKLCILKVAVSELLTSDIYSLTELPCLTVLSLRVQTAPEGKIIFSEGALPVLRYFRFECGVLCLEFRPGAMPNLHRLKLGFNSEQENYGNVLAGIEYLLNLQHIAARIGADAVVGEFNKRAVESALKKSISKHPRCPNLNVQWVTSTDEQWHHLEKQHPSQEKGSPAVHGVVKTESVEDNDKQPLGKDSEVQSSAQHIGSSTGQDGTIEKEQVEDMNKHADSGHGFFYRPTAKGAYNVHSSMCSELTMMLDKVSYILPLIEGARPGCKAGIQELHNLYNIIEKGKLIIQHCVECSKLYLALTGEAIVSRCERIRDSLRRSLFLIKNMVPPALANQ
ncbi:hypothetical protein E2562_027285, partial [Oryza meyeriana var. granulata]